MTGGTCVACSTRLGEAKAAQKSAGNEARKEYRLNINIDGTYSTADGNYTVIIRDSDEEAGTFKGDYVARDAPQGEQIFRIPNGSWHHVGREKFPLSIGFGVHARPEGRPWVMRDSWVGFMPGRDSLCMVGSRSYLTGDDRSDLSELGTHSFVLVSPYPDRSMLPLPCRSDPKLEVPSMFIHEVTGTYLVTDGYSENINIPVQVYNSESPLGGHKWSVYATDDNFCLIKSSQHGRCLTVGAHHTDYPRLQRPENTFPQQWRFDPISVRPNTFAIIPRNYPDHALGIQGNNDLNDTFVVLTRMWGKPNMFQWWRQHS